MRNDTTSKIVWPASFLGSSASAADLLAGSAQDVLTEILRNGAQWLLGAAVEAEVAGYIDRHAGHVDEKGHRLVVRNGHHRERTIQTGLGAVTVKAPRVEDRRVVGRDADGASIDQAGRPVDRFYSTILPRYLRRTRSIEELIPWLYLKGISTGDFVIYQSKPATSYRLKTGHFEEAAVHRVASRDFTREDGHGEPTRDGGAALNLCFGAAGLVASADCP